MNNLQEHYDYKNMTDDERLTVLKDLYCVKLMSWAQISKLCGTYTNKIVRDATKLGIKSRDKSEAQKAAIDTGRSKHPTLGMKRDEKITRKISDSVANVWKNLSPEELDKRCQNSKEAWDSKTEEDLRTMQELANKAMKKASTDGSKLERFLHKELITLGYRVQFHKEQFLKNERFQLDLFLPELDIAIEVDGPTHYKQVWTVKELEKAKKRDSIKDGLIMGIGLNLIRVRQTKNMSNAYGTRLLNLLVEEIEKIKSEKTKSKIIHIEEK